MSTLSSLFLEKDSTRFSAHFQCHFLNDGECDICRIATPQYGTAYMYVREPFAADKEAHEQK